MKVTIVGAGAIGGLMGVSMIRAGLNVTFVDVDKDRVNGINTKGMTVHTPTRDVSVPAKAVLPEQISGPLDMVYLAVKSQNTEAAMSSIVPHLAPDSVVVSLQNGFNEEIIARLIGVHRTIGAFVNYGGASLNPGELEGQCPTEAPLYIGELDGSITPRLRLIQSQCANHCPTWMTSNIWGYLWSKEVNALSIIFTGLADVTTGEAWSTDENMRVGAALISEGLNVADVAGIKLENYGGWDPTMYRPKTKEETSALLAILKANNKRTTELAAQHPAVYKPQKKASGIWWDLMYRKRKSEADWLAGPIIKKGESLGVDVSLSKAMLKMINEIEDGRRGMSKENFSEMYRIMKDLGKDLP